MADWAGAYGAAGAVDYLKDMVAERLLAQKQAEIERAAKAAEVEQISQRNQQANQFNQGQVAAQERFTGERDDRYQNRLQDVKFNDLRILDKEKDRETDKELRRIDAEAREKARLEEHAWNAAEHEKNRALTISEGAANRRSMEARAAASSGGGLDAGEKARLTLQLGKTYMFNTKAQREIQRQYALMAPAVEIIKTKGHPGYGNAEQVVVNAFNKIIDPNSVVREGEYDRTAKGQALLARMEVYAQRIKQGGTITPQTLLEMSDLAKTYNDQATSYNERVKKLTTKQAIAFGMDPTILFMEDDEDAPAKAGAPPAAAAAPSTLGRKLPANFGQ